MENPRILVAVAVLSLIGMLVPSCASAYEVHTHQELTRAAIASYERLHGDQFIAEYEDKIISGSAGEDESTRPLRHFYDPVFRRGLSVGGMEYMASKYWAQDTISQGNFNCIGAFVCAGKHVGYDDKYFSSPTDYSWERAVYEYVYGDAGRGMATLGHILHLIQDATVPAHVRNDPHLNHDGYGDADLYERYASSATSTPLIDNSGDVPSYPGLGEVFDAVAQFTNNNFLSKDRLFNTYKLPDLVSLTVDGGFALNKKLQIKVARVTDTINFRGEVEKRDINIDSDEDVVLSDYWRVLSREAVRNGVAVMDLFFREVEQERQTGTLKKKNISQAERDANEAARKSFSVVKSLYGSSLEQGDVDELMGQGAAAALAQSPSPVVGQISPPVPQRPVVLVESTPQPIRPDRTITELVVDSQVPNEPTPVPGQNTTPPVPRSPWEIHQNGPIMGGGGGGSAAAVVVSSDTPPVVDDEEDETDIEDVPVVEPMVLFSASSTPPLLSIDECTASLSSEFCFLPATSAQAAWTPVHGAVYYELTLNGTAVATTTSLTLAITLADHASTTAHVTAYDASSTPVVSNEATAYVFTSPVVINEIGWAGTLASEDDEWLELKNRTRYTLDLSRLVVRAVDGGATIIPLSGTIPPSGDDAAFGFYLIERNKKVLFNVPEPNLITTFDALPDSGAELVLAYANASSTTILDRTPPVSACSGWCAGTVAVAVSDPPLAGYASKGIFSMERTDAAVSGAVSTNWHSNDVYTAQAFDTNSDGFRGRVFGTPSYENSKGWPEVGWYCLGDTGPIASGATYAPQSDLCTYLTRFVDQESPRAGALFKGEVGSSTLAADSYPHDIRRFEFNFTSYGDRAGDGQPGDKYFVAIWEVRVGNWPYDPHDRDSFVSYFSTGHPITGNALDGYVVSESTEPPHTNFRVIPWVYGTPAK